MAEGPDRVTASPESGWVGVLGQRIPFPTAQTVLEAPPVVSV